MNQTATKPKPQNGAMVAQQQPSPTPAEGRVMEYVPFGGLPKDTIKLTMAAVRNLVAEKTRTGKLPTDEQIMKFMLLCKARLLNPFEGDAFLVGYDTNDGPKFSLITSIQAYLKRAAMSRDFDGMDSGVIVKDAKESIVNREGDFCLDTDTLVGAWAVVYFKGKSHPMKERISLSAYRKSYGRWKEDPAGMLVKCAEHSALRKAFPAMMLDMGKSYEEPIDPSERQGMPESAQFAPIEQVNGSRKAISDAQEASLNEAIAEHEASAMLVRSFYNLTHGQKMLAADYDGCLAKIKAGDFSSPRGMNAGLAEGELPNEGDGLGDLAEYTAEEVEAVVNDTAVYRRFGVKRAADLTQEQRRQIMDEAAQVS